MSNIFDLSHYRTQKEQVGKKSGPSEKDERSFKEKLQDLIHRPFNGTRSKEELIAIFEEEQLKKDKEGEN